MGPYTCSCGVTVSNVFGFGPCDKCGGNCVHRVNKKEDDGDN